MFQSNSAKEILYIFLWLIGIVFVYGLVHTFLLEPSKSATSHIPVAQTVSSTSNKHTPTTKNTVKEVLSTPEVTIPVAVVAVPVANKIIQKEKSSAKHSEKTGSWIYGSFFPHIKTPDVHKVTERPSIKANKQSTNSKKISIKKEPDTTTHKNVSNTVKKSIILSAEPSVPSLPTIPTVPIVPSVKKVIPLQDE